MRLNVPSDGGNGGLRRPSAVALRNGVRNGGRGLRSAARFLRRALQHPAPSIQVSPLLAELLVCCDGSRSADEIGRDLWKRFGHQADMTTFVDACCCALRELEGAGFLRSLGDEAKSLAHVGRNNALDL